MQAHVPYSRYTETQVYTQKMPSKTLANIHPKIKGNL